MGGTEAEGADLGMASSSADAVPKTFEDMGLFNARMIGANMSWVEMVFSKFDLLVRSTVNNDLKRMEQETSILALRMNKDTKGKIELKEFGVCMGSSLQALRGKAWTTQHSQAWSHLWDIVGGSLQAKLHLPAKYEKEVSGLVGRVDEEETKSFAMAVFKRLFDAV